jgi:hypothetical protein
MATTTTATPGSSASEIFFHSDITNFSLKVKEKGQNIFVVE